MIFIIFLSVLLTFIIYFVYQFRYQFDYVTLYIITFLQGTTCKMVHTKKDIKETLMLSDKGTVIEELLASPAWLPILSIESVNHSMWHELKTNFITFQRLLPPRSVLGDITEYELKNFLAKNDNVLNSKDISKLTLKIFTNWIFKDTTFEHDSTLTGLTDDMLERIHQSSIEYRKEIAIKGKGDVYKKQEAIDIMVHLMNNNSKFKSTFPEWKKPEYYSALMQPFIISPMINVSDIAVSVKNNLPVYEHMNKDINLFIDHCIQISHPFPMLERYDSQTNTQIFIDLAALEETEKSYLFNYSYGPRACLGRLIAREFLGKFFKTIIDLGDGIDYKPTEQHLYSGRDNDKGNINESLYQLKIVSGIIIDLIKKRVFQKST